MCDSARMRSQGTVSPRAGASAVGLMIVSAAWPLSWVFSFPFILLLTFLRHSLFEQKPAILHCPADELSTSLA